MQRGRAHREHDRAIAKLDRAQAVQILAWRVAVDVERRKLVHLH
jgi:hypothetical protein